MSDEHENVREGESSETTAMLAGLAEGAAKILDNASDLYNEALLLRNAGALSRALTLHQISLEECSKIDMLGAWASGKLMGYEGPDLDDLAKVFANHRAKNYTNAYMIPAGEAELTARNKGNSDQALRAFEAMQAEFHTQSNAAKNASLYVDLKDGEFIAPKDRITSKMVENIAAMNEAFLGQGQLMTRMLYRWSRNPSVVDSMFSWFEPRLKELSSQNADVGDVLANMLDELLARASSTGYAEAMTRQVDEDD